MVVRLRFALDGIRNNRILHLVATNHRKRRDGKPIELLGIYNSRVKPGESEKRVEWSPKRIRYWLGVGAVPSKSVVKLLEMGNILEPGSRYHPKALQSSVPDTSSSPKPQPEEEAASKA